jgi:hypothetical protein
MPLLPVAAREVREASRQPRTYRWRWVTAAAALAFMSFVAWVTRYSPSQGHEVFVAVSTVAYIYCLLAGAARTADSISEEKRDNTLGLLFLTDLKGWDIVFGKLLSSSVNCVFGLLALFPMLAIPALMGGVPWSEFAKVVLNLLNTLFLSISCGFLVSSLLRHSLATVSSALIIMIGIGGPVAILAQVLRLEYHERALSELVMFLSPTEPHINAFGAPGNYFNHYWGPLLLHHVVAWCNLRAAIFFLPRMWQEVPKNKKTERWREKIRAWRFGKGKAKARFRARLLNENPLYWLSNREQVSSGGVMILAALILCGALFVGMAAARGPRIDSLVLSWMLGTVLVHLLIAFRLATAASWRLAEDRRSGALELLLGTELSVRELLRGHRMALRRQFFGPALIVNLAAIFALALLLQMFSADMALIGLWDTLFAIFSGQTRNAEMGLVFFMVASIHVMLTLNWIGIGSVGMWMGLREKRSGFAAWITLATVLLPPWVLLIFGMIALEEAGAMRTFPPQLLIPWVILVAWLLGLSHLLFLWLWSRRNLLKRFREIAADRYAGPRPFPWKSIGWVGVRLAGGATALWLLLAVVRGWINYSGERAWQKALAAHPEFASYQSTRAFAPIPDAENLAKIPLFTLLNSPAGASKQITWNMSQLLGPGRNDQLRWDWGEHHALNVGHIRDIYRQRKLLTTNESAAAAEQVLAALQKIYYKDFATLRNEAAARPKVRFEIDSSSSQQFGVPVAPWAMFYSNNDLRPILRGVVDTISVKAAARVAAGENPIDDILLGLRLAGGIEADPRSLIQYHEMLLDMTQPVYDGLAARRWNNDDLKRLQDYYSGLDLWTNYEAFRKNYVFNIVGFREAPLQSLNGGFVRRKKNWFERQMPTGFVRKNQASTLEWGVTQSSKAVDLKKQRIDLSMAQKIAESNPQNGYYFGASDNLQWAVRSLAFTQTTVDQIIVACAVERFRNDNQKVPATLNELVPRYLPAVPNDPVIEKPLAYRVKDDREHYIIYSVGSDGADNNGTPMPIAGTWQAWQDRPGDWVWDSQPTDPPPPAPERSRKK